MKRVPKFVAKLEENEVFVFPSNLKGLHGNGAARHALRFGAEAGCGVGLRGQTYAIPTMSYMLTRLDIKIVAGHVDTFINVAQAHQHLTFLVAPMGVEIAGYSVEEIAPLFRRVLTERVTNVVLPQTFTNLLEK